MIRRLAATGAVVACLSCAQLVPQGHLALCWHLPERNLADLQSLEIEPIWAGAAQGSRRNGRWQAIAVRPSGASGTLRFPTGDGGPALVASGWLPAGRYSHVYAAAGELRAVAHDGQLLLPANHLEPIALPVTIRASTIVTAEIELIVLEQAARSGGGRQVFVKDAQVQEMGHGSGSGP